jgi:hypothetical protein
MNGGPVGEPLLRQPQPRQPERRNHNSLLYIEATS